MSDRKSGIQDIVDFLNSEFGPEVRYAEEVRTGTRQNAEDVVDQLVRRSWDACRDEWNSHRRLSTELIEQLSHTYDLATANLSTREQEGSAQNEHDAVEAFRDRLSVAQELKRLRLKANVMDGLQSFRQRFDVAGPAPRFDTADIILRMLNVGTSSAGADRLRDAYRIVQFNQRGRFLRAVRTELGGGYQSLRRYMIRLFGEPPWSKRDDQDFREKILRAHEALEFHDNL
jgi:hypothetical protein